MFKRYKDDKQIVWYDEALLSEPPRHCFDIDYWKLQGKVTGSAQGRGTTWFIQLSNELQGALRHYRRGGLFGRFIKEHYLYTGLHRNRAYLELCLLKQLQEKQVNVPKPVAARLQKIGLVYRADIMVERIANARDLVAILEKQTLDNDVYQRIGQEVRKMHDAQVNHTDLNIHNILLDDNSIPWIIDFDKCYKQDGDAWKEKNLERLKRSFNKEVNKCNIQWQDNHWEALLSGYHGGIISGEGYR